MRIVWVKSFLLCLPLAGCGDRAEEQRPTEVEIQRAVEETQAAAKEFKQSAAETAEKAGELGEKSFEAAKLKGREAADDLRRGARKTLDSVDEAVDQGKRSLDE